MSKLLSLLAVLCLAVPVLGQTLQELVDAVPDRGGLIQLEPISYYVHGPLNVREKQDLIIQGSGNSTKLVFVTSDGQELLADFTGASYITVRDLHVVDTGPPAKVGFLLSRIVYAGVAQGMAHARFERIKMETTNTIANVVSLGAEVDTWEQCRFSNNAPGSWNFVTGRDNWVGATSPFGPVTGGSNIVHTYRNCSFGNYAFSQDPQHVGREGNIWFMDGTGYVRLEGGSFSNKYIRSDPSRFPTAEWNCVGIRIGGRMNRYGCIQIVLDGIQCETYAVKNCIDVFGVTRGLVVRDALLCSQEAAVRVGPGGQLNGATFENVFYSCGRARYDWKTGPERALVFSEGGFIRDSKFDFRDRTLAKLWYRYPWRTTPTVAFSAYQAGAVDSTEFILQRREDAVIDTDVTGKARKFTVVQDEPTGNE